MAAHKNLASKILCFCCRDCEQPQSIEDPKVPSETQEKQPLNNSLQLQKEELDRQNSKHTDTRCLMYPAKSTSSSISELPDLNAEVSQGRFYKRNLNRYYQEHWPFQPCLIGRP
ncbi:testis-expressed protein 48 [Cavia porcellus]|uniref:testis-expressed protein 48 n=1 Tax=Cavia porcellus TaxID=10141 RepID=UPI002FE2E2EA